MAHRPAARVVCRRRLEVRVWEKLLTIQMGRFATSPTSPPAPARRKAARAVGAASQETDLLRCAVPPHHGKTGELTGYRWGLTRKRAMLGWEAGMAGA